MHFTTKETPYELYIQYDKLVPLFSQPLNKEERFLVCGITAIELSCDLLNYQYNQNEPKLELIDSLLQEIKTQFHLLVTHKWTINLQETNGFHSKSIEKLKELGKEYTKEIREITDIYFNLSEKVNIGINAQINEIREYFNLPSVSINKSELKGDLSQVKLYNLFDMKEEKLFNPDDLIFKRTHQISECWFNLILGECDSITAGLRAETIDYDELKDHFTTVSNILSFLSEHIFILEHMIVASYHYLRVGLRGASGGQSKQAFEMFSAVKSTFKEFLNVVNKQETTIVEILEYPKKHPILLRQVNQFSKIENVLKNFFFQHYMLSSNVIGSQSFGSIGKDLVSLTDKFVEPIFKEIDDAKYHLTLKTNFQYGSKAGILLLEKEPSVEVFNASNIDQKLVDTAISNYFKAISALDLDGWVALFNKDGYIEDPVGSRPYIGHQQLGIFFKGVVRFFKKLNMKVEKIVPEPDGVAVFWKADALAFNNQDIQFNGKEVFQINADGEIQTAKVYWDPTQISDQIKG